MIGNEYKPRNNTERGRLRWKKRNETEYQAKETK